MPIFLLSKNKLHELICDCLSHRYDSCTRGCCRASNFEPSDPKAGALTTQPSCFLKKLDCCSFEPLLMEVFMKSTQEVSAVDRTMDLPLRDDLVVSVCLFVCVCVCVCLCVFQFFLSDNRSHLRNLNRR